MRITNETETVMGIPIARRKTFSFNKRETAALARARDILEQARDKINATDSEPDYELARASTALSEFIDCPEILLERESLKL